VEAPLHLGLLDRAVLNLWALSDGLILLDVSPPFLVPKTQTDTAADMLCSYFSCFGTLEMDESRSQVVLKASMFL
jgi:hypothetical protein